MRHLLIPLVIVAIACGDDATTLDAGPTDAGAHDAGPRDSGPSDDAGTPDASPRDAAVHDASRDADLDAGSDDAGSDDAADADVGPRSFRFDFEEGAEGWQAEFADFPVGIDAMDPAFYGLVGEVRAMPPIAGADGQGFFLSGDNHSDDLWMAIVREFRLAPGTAYTVEVELALASEYGTGCLGIGGSPGDSVYLKTGGTPGGLVTTIDGGDHVRWVSPDKGNQAEIGPDAASLGTMANGSDCGDPAFVMVERTASLTLASDAEGHVTVFVGSDSGFEGRSNWYIDTLTIVFTPSE